MDAATEGARRGHFRSLPGDLLSYPIESQECVYKAESLAGDELSVSVWENQAKPTQLFCQIDKQEKSVWIGSITFAKHVDLDAKL